MLTFRKFKQIIKAPFIGVLFLVGILMGNYLSITQHKLEQSGDNSFEYFWIMQFLKLLIVVIVSTSPELLLRYLSRLISSSRVMSLIITLLLVITLGIFMLKLNLLIDMLILSSSLLLARLELEKNGLSLHPFWGMFLLASLVISGAIIGHYLPDFNRLFLHEIDSINK